MCGDNCNHGPSLKQKQDGIKSVLSKEECEFIIELATLPRSAVKVKPKIRLSLLKIGLIQGEHRISFTTLGADVASILIGNEPVRNVR